MQSRFEDNRKLIMLVKIFFFFFEICRVHDLVIIHLWFHLYIVTTIIIHR